MSEESNKIAESKAPSNIDDKVSLIFLAFIIVAAACTLSKISGTLPEICLGLYLGVKILVGRFNLGWRHFVFVGLVLLVIIQTGIKSASGTVIDIYQILRSSIWFGLYCIILSTLEFTLSKQSKSDVYRILYIIEWVLIFSFILVVIEVLTGLELSPAAIRVIDEEVGGVRLYVVASSALLPLLFTFLQREKYIVAGMVIFLALMTQGKTMLIACAVIVLFYSVKKKGMGLWILAMMAGVTYVFFSADRLNSFVEGGDLQRLRQINEAWIAYTQNAFTILFGIGHGIPYSEGYSQFGYINPDQARLYENSKYDVENLPLYILLRYGFLGACFFLALTIWSVKNPAVRIQFVIMTVFVGMGGAFPATPGGCAFAGAFVLASVCATKFRNN